MTRQQLTYLSTLMIASSMLAASLCQAQSQHRSMYASGLQTFNSQRALSPTGSLTTATLHEHGHTHASPAESPSVSTIKAPTIFLDKSEAIVWYQLNRLETAELLAIPRDPHNELYQPVYSAILMRENVSPNILKEALTALTTFHQSNEVEEILNTMQTLAKQSSKQKSTASSSLANLLLTQPVEALRANADRLKTVVQNTDPNSIDSQTKASAYAALVLCLPVDVVWNLPQEKGKSQIDLLEGLKQISDLKILQSYRPGVYQLLNESKNESVVIAAMSVAPKFPENAQEFFLTLASKYQESRYEVAAVDAMLRLHESPWPLDVVTDLAQRVVSNAEKTPPSKRTTPQFLNSMQLADKLLTRMPLETARQFRSRLREIAVRVVQIRTVEEEMRYDTPYFAVQAGRDVQVVLINEDLMPHNLVITTPGNLKLVAEEGAALGPVPGFQKKLYVPQSPEVLHATHMIDAHQQGVLTFKAPTQTGEYPYVCTFPRHWMRMYGVMVVVDDLDAFLAHPVTPKDPIGSNRSFVKNWSVDDFKNTLDQGLLGRSPEIGHKLFVEASCAQCHQVQGVGGKVGPELDTLLTRWKGDRLGVLREILDPSHKIDDKYLVKVVITSSGNVFTGIVVSEDKNTLSLLDNPEATSPRVINKRDIEEMSVTTTSLMPKALLDRFTEDEIYEVLSYIESIQSQPVP